MEKSYRKLAREKATIGIYQNLLVESDLKEIKLFLENDEKLSGNSKSMDFAVWLVETTLKNKDNYSELLSKYLKKGWPYDRLSPMERAILLIAACEVLESDLPNNIIINEAVMSAKKFCDDDTYKFINGVLSNIA